MAYIFSYVCQRGAALYGASSVSAMATTIATLLYNASALSSLPALWNIADARSAARGALHADPALCGWRQQRLCSTSVARTAGACAARQALAQHIFLYLLLRVSFACLATPVCVFAHSCGVYIFARAYNVSTYNSVMSSSSSLFLHPLPLACSFLVLPGGVRRIVCVTWRQSSPAYRRVSLPAAVNANVIAAGVKWRMTAKQQPYRQLVTATNSGDNYRWRRARGAFVT